MLQHPHIVPLLNAGQAGTLLYYTMPYVEGESLRARLARLKELPVSETLHFLRDMLEALAYAHERGVIHRDIKPDNVLISGSNAMITDFGLAKALTAATKSGSLTATGIIVGTPAYMSPEQIVDDSTVDHRSDLYAVGVLGYEMLAGSALFAAPSAQALMAAHVTQAPEPLAARRASVPPAVAAVLTHSPEARFRPSAIRFRDFTHHRKRIGDGRPIADTSASAHPPLGGAGHHCNGRRGSSCSCDTRCARPPERPRFEGSQVAAHFGAGLFVLGDVVQQETAFTSAPRCTPADLKANLRPSRRQASTALSRISCG